MRKGLAHRGVTRNIGGAVKGWCPRLPRVMKITAKAGVKTPAFVFSNDREPFPLPGLCFVWGNPELPIDYAVCSLDFDSMRNLIKINRTPSDVRLVYIANHHESP